MANPATLPEEIIVDILHRLPAKSIGKFRCVSKPWRSLLSHPKFIKNHLNFNKTQKNPQQQQSLILISNSHSLYSITLTPHTYFQNPTTILAKKLSFYNLPNTWDDILASCDGLILLQDEQNTIFLTNPLTQEMKKIPISPFALPADASFTMYGVGYDSVNHDYKIVTLSYYDTDNEHEPDCTEMFVSVYSVKNGDWKRVESSPYDHAVGHVTPGVFVDGFIHWLAGRTSDYSSVIAAFDLVEEKFCEVPPPRSVDVEKFVFNHLVVLGGCLCMFPSSYNVETDVWVMKEYGVEDSWTKFTVVDVERAEFRPLCLLGEEEVVMVKDEETVEEKLVVYNLREVTFEDIVVNGIPDDFRYGGAIVESLVSPNWSDECVRERESEIPIAEESVEAKN